MDGVIGIDIGTQGTKAAVFAADGTALAEAFAASELKRPGPGVVEEDPERQLASVCETVRECLAKARAVRVAAVAIDGQMAGVIGVGRDGLAVTPYDSWLDTRCAPYMEKMKAEAGAEIVAKTGNAPSINHGPKKLWWKHEHPEVYGRIAAFVQPGGYAAMRLCGLSGEHAFVDHTYLHFSGFADNRARAWDPALCRAFGLDAAKLPRIAEPAEIVGTVTAEMAAASGLPRGTPVAAGCGDTAASFLACGATAPGVCVDVAGTASVFAGTTRELRPDPTGVLGVGRSAVPGLWHPYAYINGGGMNLEWFRAEVAGARAGDAGFRDLEELARRVEPSAVPLFVPHMEGRVCPGSPRMRGAFADLSWKCTLGHLYRAILESVALEYGLYAGILERLYPQERATEVRVTGGGEKSALWNEIKATVVGVPVVQISGSAGAPMGAAMVAARAAGLTASLESAAATWVGTGARFAPQAAARAHYREKLARYGRLVAAIDAFAKE